MSEYWKSNPRKFCDFCKCWIAENKPSVEFHERGKRHKENVQIRISAMAKKGKEDYEAQQQEGDFLKSMEEAALQAYKNDIEQNPDMTGTKISEIASSKNAEIIIKPKKAPKEPEPEPEPEPKEVVKKWYEAKSPEGNCYYWNIETGASRWEEPEEGFLTLAEQDKLKKKEETKPAVENKKTKLAGENKKTKPAGENKKTTEEKKSSALSEPPVVYGPTQKVEAYSSWKQIEEDPEPETDFELPELLEEEYYGPELSFKRPEITFKEKTVTLSDRDKGSGGTVSFKKRKGTQDLKKSMRQRTNDL